MASSSERSDIVNQINTRKFTLEEVCNGTRYEQLIPFPKLKWTRSLIAQCEDIYQQFVVPNTGKPIPSGSFIQCPKWIFLEYLVKHRDILLHGSGTLIDEFEPRSSNDNIKDGHKPRVYAASSGILASFFA